MVDWIFYDNSCVIVGDGFGGSSCNWHEWLDILWEDNRTNNRNNASLPPKQSQLHANKRKNYKLMRADIYISVAEAKATWTGVGFNCVPDPKLVWFSLALHSVSAISIKLDSSLLGKYKFFGFVTQLSLSQRASIYRRQVFLVPRSRAPSGHHHKLWPLCWTNTRSPRFVDFASNLTNLIGWEYETNTLRLLRKSGPAIRDSWSWPKGARSQGTRTEAR